MSHTLQQGLQVQVNGVVQGVGFRPTVWKIANELKLTGSVWNGADGVTIELWGEPNSLEQFLQQLQSSPPPLAIIERLEHTPLSGSPPNDFTIIPSRGGHVTTGVAADAATCPACIANVHDPDNRRYRYPFTNCTHCGPRLSIIGAVPYDRPNTSMAPFTMCPACQQEYDSPADRRFHAQPNCCPACGPQLWLEDRNGKQVDGDPITEAAAQLRSGKIVAIKGIGGIHLACDASSESAINTLRQRKQRPTKALAVMAQDLQQIRRYAQPTTLESEALQGPAAPIVILQQQGEPLPAAIAPLQQSIGFMLPYSPLHHLLMRALEHPIVLTSGNHSGQPQCISNQAAVQELSGIADYWLLHDRKIINRVDDSVVREADQQIRVIRHARGAAPETLPLPDGFEDVPPMLAMGGELKNSFALLREGRVTLSQYIGDLEDASTLQAYQQTHQLFQQLFDHHPETIVVDRHPDYLPSQLGRQWAMERGVKLIAVQHHHAHIAACMVEHQRPLNNPPLLGIALDGLGYGDDGAIWGGEFLLASYSHYQRLGHFAPIAMPGGAKASREPWRNTVAQLLAIEEHTQLLEQYRDLELIQTLQQKPLHTLQQMVEKNLNSPLASSCGRLIDAVAAAIGIAPEQLSFEGEAAITLESLATTAPNESAYPYTTTTEHGVIQLRWETLWRALLHDLKQGTDPATIAARFHQGLIHAVAETAIQLCQQQQIETVAVGGGVFQNRLLLEGVSLQLRSAGLEVLTPAKIPSSDQGIAIGQCAIAAANQRFTGNRNNQ